MFANKLVNVRKISSTIDTVDAQLESMRHCHIMSFKLLFRICNHFSLPGIIIEEHQYNNT